MNYTKYNSSETMLSIPVKTKATRNKYLPSTSLYWIFRSSSIFCAAWICRSSSASCALKEKIISKTVCQILGLIKKIIVNIDFLCYKGSHSAKTVLVPRKHLTITITVNKNIKNSTFFIIYHPVLEWNLNIFMHKWIPLVQILLSKI